VPSVTAINSFMSTTLGGRSLLVSLSVDAPE
jgi:hypothetical protein